MAGADKVVRIGCAGGFMGDSALGAGQLLDAGGLDYMVLDYLAEGTMSILGRGMAANPKSGYARDFTDWIWKDNLAALKAQGVKVITNAGGMNPFECRARMQAIAAAAGLEFKIAVVDGDDLRGRLEDYKAEGVSEMFTGQAFPDPATVVSANAYFGARPIAAALAAGAEVVITGRVVDSALTLGALVHAFGWSFEDWDKLAAGSLAGHVIECGQQATGGLFTDWEAVPGWEDIGFPILECRADGSFVVTKPAGTGGLVVPAAVAEQILYEVGDPQAYMLPDVVCDFSGVKVEQAGPHRVRVTGAKGRPATGRYKVCLTWADGWRTIAMMAVLGSDAQRKVERQAEAVLTRIGRMLRDRNLAPLRAVRTEVLGAESSYGAQARPVALREAIARVGAEHDDRRGIEVFLREWNVGIAAMAIGSAGWFGGRPDISPVVRVYSFTVDRAEVPARVSFEGRETTVAAPPVAAPFDARAVVRPEVPPAELETKGLVCVPLRAVAWARSGDKGDAFNVGVIARDPALLPYIRAALSEDAVARFFAHEFEGASDPRVVRYEVPGLEALNFHCLDALGGGQFASLRLDPLAKGKAEQLLEHPVAVPARLFKSVTAA